MKFTYFSLIIATLAPASVYSNILNVSTCETAHTPSFDLPTHILSEITADPLNAERLKNLQTAHIILDQLDQEFLKKIYADINDAQNSAVDLENYLRESLESQNIQATDALFAILLNSFAAIRIERSIELVHSLDETRFKKIFAEVLKITDAETINKAKKQAGRTVLRRASSPLQASSLQLALLEAARNYAFIYAESYFSSPGWTAIIKNPIGLDCVKLWIEFAKDVYTFMEADRLVSDDLKRFFVNIIIASGTHEYAPPLSAKDIRNRLLTYIKSETATIARTASKKIAERQASKPESFAPEKTDKVPALVQVILPQRPAVSRQRKKKENSEAPETPMINKKVSVAPTGHIKASKIFPIPNPSEMTFAERDPFTAHFFYTGEVRNAPWSRYSDIVEGRLATLAAFTDFTKLKSQFPSLEKYFVPTYRYYGYYSIRVDSQFRIFFRWQDGHAVDVEIDDYHQDKTKD